MNGINVYLDTKCVKKSGYIKIHKQKSGMSKNYHNRVQKKWAKRFGYTYDPCAYTYTNIVVIHPQIAHRYIDLKEAVNNCEGLMIPYEFISTPKDLLCDTYNKWGISLPFPDYSIFNISTA